MRQGRREGNQGRACNKIGIKNQYHHLSRIVSLQLRPYLFRSLARSSACFAEHNNKALAHCSVAGVGRPDVPCELGRRGPWTPRAASIVDGVASSNGVASAPGELCSGGDGGRGNVSPDEDRGGCEYS